MRQAVQFLLSGGLGLCLGLVYDIFRGLRRKVPWLTVPADLLFGLLWLGSSLLLALYAGGGAYRIFMLLGTALGFWAWLTLAGPFTGRFFTWVWGLLTAPFRFIFGFFKKIFKIMQKFSKNIFSSDRKSVTIKRPIYGKKQKLEERPDAAL